MGGPLKERRRLCTRADGKEKGQPMLTLRLAIQWWLPNQMRSKASGVYLIGSWGGDKGMERLR